MLTRMAAVQVIAAIVWFTLAAEGIASIGLLAPAATARSVVA